MSYEQNHKKQIKESHCEFNLTLFNDEMFIPVVNIHNQNVAIFRALLVSEYTDTSLFSTRNKKDVLRFTALPPLPHPTFLKDGTG